MKVISVRIHGRGKAYYFDPAGFDLQKGDEVIVDTAQGMDLGFCTGNISDIAEEKIEYLLKPILRAATQEDLDFFAENLKIEKEAFDIAKKKIEEHQLEMNLVDVECMMDNQKIIFYFTADGRINFVIWLKIWRRFIVPGLN